jgi:tripartite-type tricarboxylate transporter receptor subunit TctC
MSKSFGAGAAPTRRRIVTATAAIVGGITAPSFLRIGSALAAYPERPVKIVVANTPGGPSDIIARIIAAQLQIATGGTFVVENRGGAGGNIGMGAVARAEPDGYTILLSTSAYSVNPGLYPALPYDPFKDFAAICEIAVSPHVFAVKADSPAGTMKEFVAMVKKDPARYNVSTPPVGTTPQIQAEVLKLREGLKQMATIVYAGGGDALNALLSNTVQLSSGVLAPAHPQIKAGAIKGLAVTGERRWHDLPEIPTMIESGYEDFVFDTYTALMAPARMPADAVAFLEKEVLAALSNPELQKKLTEAGFEVTARSGEGHMARIRREVPMFKKIIAEAGIKLGL